MTDDDPAFLALVQTLRELPAIDRKRVCAMPARFWQDFGMELTAATTFGDPGSIAIKVYHRDHGNVQQVEFAPERTRKYRVEKLCKGD